MAGGSPLTSGRDVGSSPLPRSVSVIVGLHVLAALAFGVLAHLDPGNQFPDLVRNDDGSFAVGLYANRNIGVGVALAAALALRSRLMIVGLMIARFVTDVADLVLAFTQSPPAAELGGTALFFTVLFASELFVLDRLTRAPSVAMRSTTTEEVST